MTITGQMDITTVFHQPTCIQPRQLIVVLGGKKSPAKQPASQPVIRSDDSFTTQKLNNSKRIPNFPLPSASSSSTLYTRFHYDLFCNAYEVPSNLTSFSELCHLVNRLLTQCGGDDPSIPPQHSLLLALKILILCLLISVWLGGFFSEMFYFFF